MKRKRGIANTLYRGSQSEIETLLKDLRYLRDLISDYLGPAESKSGMGASNEKMLVASEIELAIRLILKNYHDEA